MMPKSRSIVFLLLASVLLQVASGDPYDGRDAERVRMRSVQVGTNYCTDAPDEACYPSTNGFPACCGVPDTCPEEKQPCENGTPVATPTTPTFSPAPSRGRDPTPQPGSSYCTFEPDLECYPFTNGFPACCADGPETCPVARPACDDASDVPSIVPTPATSGGSPSALPTPEKVGDSYCTYAPDLACYPSTNGYPACCSEDAESCPTERPPCENLPTSSPVTTTAAPSPAPSPEGPTAGSPTTTSSAVAMAWTAPAFAMAAIVGVTVAQVGFN